jgi:hypothetical protein
VVIAIVLLTVEIPLPEYALRPEATSRTLRRAEGWIDRHGRQALITTLVVMAPIYSLMDCFSFPSVLSSLSPDKGVCPSCASQWAGQLIKSPPSCRP